MQRRREVSAHPAPPNPSALLRPASAYRVLTSHASRPHPAKKVGEDAHVVHTTDAVTTAAIYDGVGSWSFEQGIDVSAFSRRMADLTEAALKARMQPPDALLHAVWESVGKEDVVGSCTACIVQIDGTEDEQTAVLRACTVGDSGFLVLRRLVDGEERVDATDTRLQRDDATSEVSPITSYSALLANSATQPPQYYVHYRSMQQLHYFNCPYQLGITAQSPPASSSSSPSSPFDLPSSALLTQLRLRASDVVVIASDGLFDNLDEVAILALASPSLSAEQLVTEGWERSLDKGSDGPFAVAAKDHGVMWGGGRKDDITVVVMHVQRNDDSSTEHEQQQRRP